MKISDRFGYRGTCLIILGTIWILFGISTSIDAQPRHELVLHEHLPPWLHTGAWIFTGALAVVAGLRGKHRDDTFGMTALMVLPMIRMLSFLASWLVYLVLSAWHWYDPAVEVAGYARGWYSASVWALVVTLLVLVAGWPNPRQVLPLPHEEDEK